MISTPRVTRHRDSPVGKELALRVQAYAFDCISQVKKQTWWPTLVILALGRLVVQLF